MSDYATESFLPVHGNSYAERRMRVHQQWWAWQRVKRPMGQLRPKAPFPVLTKIEQETSSTSNFVTESIHRVAVNTPGLSSDPHFNHVLSSLPMAVNLFGVLIDPETPLTTKTPLERAFPRVRTPYAPAPHASRLIGALLGKPAHVLRVDFEIPGRIPIDRVREHPLRDGTSADVLLEVQDDSGIGVIVIETKLTEPLSNGGDLLDSSRLYKTLFDAPPSPFCGPMSTDIQTRLLRCKLVQWARNHLLAHALEKLGGYSFHKYWTVFPGAHTQAIKAAHEYPLFLKNAQSTFAWFTLESMLKSWSTLPTDLAVARWHDKFRERYLDLTGSDELWTLLSQRRTPT